MKSCLFSTHKPWFILLEKFHPKEKKNEKNLNWVWNTALHTCIRKGPGGCTCTQVSQAWSGLVWSQSSSPSQWLTMWRLSNTQNWCARFLLFLHPWAISFCPPTACLLFIALQLICLVLNEAEQTWVSWVDMSIPGPDFEPLRARLEARLSEHRFVLFCGWAELSWSELMFLLCMCKGLLSTNWNFFIEQHKNSSLSYWIQPNSSLDNNNILQKEIKQNSMTTHVIHNLNLVSSSSSSSS